MDGLAGLMKCMNRWVDRLVGWLVRLADWVDEYMNRWVYRLVGWLVRLADWVDEYMNR